MTIVNQLHVLYMSVLYHQSRNIFARVVGPIMTTLIMRLKQSLGTSGDY